MDGPFSEAKEVSGGFAIFEFKSMKQAVESAKDFMELHRRYWRPSWQEVRPMFDKDDFVAGRRNK